MTLQIATRNNVHRPCIRWRILGILNCRVLSTHSYIIHTFALLHMQEQFLLLLFFLYSLLRHCKSLHFYVLRQRYFDRHVYIYSEYIIMNLSFGV